MIADERRRRRGLLLIGAVTVLILAVVTGPHLHLHNWRFLWNPDVADALKGASGVGDASSRASGRRFSTRLRSPAHRWRWSSSSARSPATISPASPSPAGLLFLQGLLVLHAFPAMTLIIPIFLMMYWIGLQDTIVGVILVITRARAAVRHFRHEGLLRCRALGHRDERHDRRRVAAAGLPPRRAAAGEGRHAGRSRSSPSSAAGRSTSSSARS